MTPNTERKPTLVLGGTGKTGRRVAERLTEVLDGRNAHVVDGVQRPLGREPRDFRDYARDAAATGVWNGTSR